MEWVARAGVQREQGLHELFPVARDLGPIRQDVPHGAACEAALEQVQGIHDPIVKLGPRSRGAAMPHGVSN